MNLFKSRRCWSLGACGGLLAFFVAPSGCGRRAASILATSVCHLRCAVPRRGIPAGAIRPSPSLPVVGFDLDNTLWDTVSTLKAAHMAMVAATPDLPSATKTHAGWRQAVLSTIASQPDRAHDFTFLRKQTLARLLGCERLAEKAFAAWFDQRNAPCFFPGAVEMLRVLRRMGFRLCAISDGNARPMEIPELADTFEFAVNSVDAGAPKPDPRPFRLAAEMAGVPCSAMIYVGDNYEKDVLGAKSLGMRAVWLRVSPLADPDFVISASSKPAVAQSASIADAEVDSVVDLPEVLKDLWLAGPC